MPRSKKFQRALYQIVCRLWLKIHDIVPDRFSGTVSQSKGKKNNNKKENSSKNNIFHPERVEDNNNNNKKEEE